MSTRTASHTDRLTTAHKVLPPLGVIAAAYAVLVMVLALSSCTAPSQTAGTPTPVAPAWKDAPDNYKLAIAVSDPGCGHPVATGCPQPKCRPNLTSMPQLSAAPAPKAPAHILPNTSARIRAVGTEWRSRIETQ